MNKNVTFWGAWFLLLFYLKETGKQNYTWLEVFSPCIAEMIFTVLMSTVYTLRLDLQYNNFVLKIYSAILRFILKRKAARIIKNNLKGK